MSKARNIIHRSYLISSSALGSGCSAVVEHNPYNQEAPGSNPAVSRGLVPNFFSVLGP